MRAMGGAGIDHPRVALGKARRFARGVVGKAQDHEIGAAHRIGARGHVLTLLLGKRDERDAAMAREALTDLQPRRPCLAIDEDALHHDGPPHRPQHDAAAGPFREPCGGAQLRSMWRFDRAGKAEMASLAATGYRPMTVLLCA